MLPLGAYRKNACNVSDEYGICPNCGSLHGDMWEYCHDECEIICHDCKTTFTVIADYSVRYLSYPIAKKEKKVVDGL